MQDWISSDGQYCSQECLLGLATESRSKIDPDCPNAAKHGQRHLRRSDFISLIQDYYLTLEKSSSSFLVPLNVSGSRGSLFRLCLPSHGGYVLLAKGVQQEDECHLLNEAMIYHRLTPIQGKYIPVCIGDTTLSPHHPLIISGGGGQLAQRATKIITRLLFVSYAGITMERSLNETNGEIIAQGTKDCLKAIHSLGVLHTDAFANNILLHDGQVRIIDFERSKTREKVEKEEQEQGKEQEWAKRQEQDGEIEERSEWKEGEMSWWEFCCEKEIWSAVYPARTWLSVVGKIF